MSQRSPKTWEMISTKAKAWRLGWIGMAAVFSLTSKPSWGAPHCGHRLLNTLDRGLVSLLGPIRRMTRGSVKQPDAAQAARVRDLLSDHTFPAPVHAATVDRLLKATGLKPEQLVDIIGMYGRPFSMPVLSSYYVSSAAWVEKGSRHLPSGSIVLGNNIELPGSPLSATSHSEGSLIARAMMLGVTKLTHLSVWGSLGLDGPTDQSMPCFHCRQLMNELDASDELRIRVAGNYVRLLSDLSPDPFGPKDLGLTAGLLAHEIRFDPGPFEAEPLDDRKLSDDPRIASIRQRATFGAASAAGMAYVPCTNTAFGVSLVACPADPSAPCVIARGAEIEACNYNGTLRALTVAIADLTSRFAGVFHTPQRALSSIREVYLFEEELTGGRKQLKFSTNDAVRTVQDLFDVSYPNQEKPSFFRVRRIKK